MYRTILSWELASLDTHEKDGYLRISIGNHLFIFIRKWVASHSTRVTDCYPYSEH